jgi:4-hydroxybenzoate polyprenyltransferase
MAASSNFSHRMTVLGLVGVMLLSLAGCGINNHCGR